jgi:hypothetical protein
MTGFEELIPAVDLPNEFSLDSAEKQAIGLLEGEGINPQDRRAPDPGLSTVGPLLATSPAVSLNVQRPATFFQGFRRGEREKFEGLIRGCLIPQPQISLQTLDPKTRMLFKHCKSTSFPSKGM